MLFDAGLAGICFPREYGGQGLTPAHQRALNEELAGYEYPSRIQAPTLSPCAAVLLDFGTEEQKLRHLPAILKGEEIWMQFLSEPSGGSDVAGALTSAVRDGEEWVLNGSKIWTTGAWWSDWGLCLARTNWDVPKHRGLTVFILPIRQPGLDVHRIEMLNGSKEFCQEFLTDVRVPDSDRVGDDRRRLDGGHPVDVPRAHADQLPAGHRPGGTDPRRLGHAHGGGGPRRRSPGRPLRARPGRRGPHARGRRPRAPAADRRRDRHRGDARPVGGHRPPVLRGHHGPDPDHRLRDRRCRRRGLDRRRRRAGLLSARTS